MNLKHKSLKSSSGIVLITKKFFPKFSFMNIFTKTLKNMITGADKPPKNYQPISVLGQCG